MRPRAAAGRTFSVIFAAFLCSLCCAARPVRAQTTYARASDAETLAAARALAIEGVKLSRAGFCQQAIEPLQRAEALHHSSVVLAELGECHLHMSKFVMASEALRNVTREPLANEPSAAQVSAKARAEVLLLQASSAIAHLTLEISGPPASEVEISVDGQAVPQALLGAPRPTDPGHHHITARATGFAEDSADIDLRYGDHQTVQFVLRPLARASLEERPKQAGASLAHTSARPSTSETRDERARRRGAYTSLLIGGLGIASGIGFGAAALSLKLQLDDHCQGTSCPESERDALNDARRWGLASTVSFAVGGASAVVGALLLLLPGRTRERRVAHGWSIGPGPAAGVGARASF
jgi:hypothetical protein